MRRFPYTPKAIEPKNALAGRAPTQSGEGYYPKNGGATRVLNLKKRIAMNSERRRCISDTDVSKASNIARTNEVTHV